MSDEREGANLFQRISIANLAVAFWFMFAAMFHIGFGLAGNAEHAFEAASFVLPWAFAFWISGKP